jgi:hypothetical protein
MRLKRGRGEPRRVVVRNRFLSRGLGSAIVARREERAASSEWMRIRS